MGEPKEDMMKWEELGIYPGNRGHVCASASETLCSPI